MTHTALTRRELACLAVAGAAGTLLASAGAAGAQNAVPETLTEGELLAQVVAQDVGYALTDTQTREVANALKGYPAGFAKARAFALAFDIEPAWTPYTPPVPPRKGRSK